MEIQAVLKQSTIRDLKPAPAACVEPTITLAEAINVMRTEQNGCVVECHDGDILGILTERDILNKVAGEQVSMDTPASGFMTREPKVLSADNSVWEAIRLMDEGDYRHVPLVGASGTVEGIITIQNIVEFLAELFPTEVLNVPPHPNQQMRSQEGG
jgi:CBS domain-containing protein